MRLLITEGDVGEWAAHFVQKRIQEARPGANRPFVLGLPTGNTPLGMYARLVALHRAGELSFAHVQTFNMDEYIGLSEDHPRSFHRYMRENLFDHVDMAPENIHIPDGNAPDIALECAAYEEAILRAGGVDLFIGGVGEDGHLAFNEPGSSLASRTRDKDLTENTIAANARFFGNKPEDVPGSALTVGLGTIMDAREVLVLASGPRKAQALYAAIEGGVSHMWPVSVLQMHPKAVIVADKEAVQELKYKTVRYFMEIQDEYSSVLALAPQGTRNG